jgi:hypothetical protein
MNTEIPDCLWGDGNVQSENLNMSYLRLVGFACGFHGMGIKNTNQPVF